MLALLTQKISIKIMIDRKRSAGNKTIVKKTLKIGLSREVQLIKANRAKVKIFRIINSSK